MEKILRLRKLLVEKNIDGYIIPSSDEFGSEYVADYARRLEWISGFTGSSGMLLVLPDEVTFFTDGRYIDQAKLELESLGAKIINISDSSFAEYIKKNFIKIRIGYDPKLHKLREIESIKTKEIEPVAIQENLIDIIWNNKSSLPNNKVFIHDEKYAGRSYKDKIAEVINSFNEGVDNLIITSSDSICWLLNIRGSDVEFNPIILSYAIINKSGIVKVFLFNHKRADLIKLQNIEFLPIEEFDNHIKENNFQIDVNEANAYIVSILGRRAIHKTNPISLMKALKNDVEANNIINAHIKDGLALCNTLMWIEKNINTRSVDEIEISNKIDEFRREQEDFVHPSFASIVGFKENGAIIHYRPSSRSSKIISGNGLLLIDSGGQYYDGTTDITRTIAVGEITSEQRENFTLVLKGHIALSRAIFKEGTKGSNLDVLARQFLWRFGLDYDHGTGHGVGFFLNVHEGPARISKASNDVPLMPGMVMSVEPGFYKSGEYGIRIENLVLVQKSDIAGFLEFQILSLVPIDINLIDFDYLDNREINWLKEYHASIERILLSHSKDPELISWIQEKCRNYFKVN